MQLAGAAGGVTGGVTGCVAGGVVDAPGVTAGFVCAPAGGVCAPVDAGGVAGSDPGFGVNVLVSPEPLVLLSGLESSAGLLYLPSV